VLSEKAALSPQRSLSVKSHSSDVQNVDVFIDGAAVVVTESEKVYYTTI